MRLYKVSPPFLHAQVPSVVLNRDESNSMARGCEDQTAQLVRLRVVELIKREPEIYRKKGVAVYDFRRQLVDLVGTNGDAQ